MLKILFFGFLLLPIGVGAILLIAAFIRYQSTEIAVTNRRIVAKHGFIGRDVLELEIDRTESVQVFQPFLGRIFNFGSLAIYGMGNGPMIPIVGISKPLDFKMAFSRAKQTSPLGQAMQSMNFLRPTSA
jgi:uncharacterized membrane protein YdbT with pleckstrin-like domain